MQNSDDTPQLSIRNMILGVGNGAAFLLAMAFLDPETVLATFSLELMGGNIIFVGILTSVLSAGWFLPATFLAPSLARKERLMPYYQVSAVVRFLSLAALWWVVQFARPENPVVMFSLVAGLLFAFTTCGGIGMIPFFSTVTDTIPATWRGKFFGLRWFLGGLLGFGAGFAVKHALSDESALAFPGNYGRIFLWAMLALTVGAGMFCFAEEYPRHPQKRHLPFRVELARGPRFFRKDKNYRRVIRVRALFAVLTGLSLPFIVPYALHASNMTTAMVGIFLALRALSQSLSNLLWSQISDLRGNLRLLLVSGWMMLLVVTATLAAPMIPETPLRGWLSFAGDARVAYFLLMAVLLGAARSGAMLGHNNYLLELTPNRVRPAYLAFYYAVLFPLCWVPFIGSLVIGSAHRYTLGFGLAAVLGVAMMTDLFRLSEVRGEGDGAQEGESAK